MDTNFELAGARHVLVLQAQYWEDELGAVDDPGTDRIRRANVPQLFERQ